MDEETYGKRWNTILNVQSLVLRGIVALALVGVVGAIALKILLAVFGWAVK